MRSRFRMWDKTFGIKAADKTPLQKEHRAQLRIPYWDCEENYEFNFLPKPKEREKIRCEIEVIYTSRIEYVSETNSSTVPTCTEGYPIYRYAQDVTIGATV